LLFPFYRRRSAASAKSRTDGQTACIEVEYLKAGLTDQATWSFYQRTFTAAREKGHGTSLTETTTIWSCRLSSLQYQKR